MEECQFVGLHSSVNEGYFLLGYDAASFGIWFHKFWDHCIISKQWEPSGWWYSIIS
jgi:hypothetical protein